MDALTALLDGPRARGAFLLRSVFHPPWALRVADRAPLSVVTMVCGDAWVRPDKGPLTRLRQGDVAAVRGPEPYVLADGPATPVQFTVDPDQRCAAVPGTDATRPLTLSGRTWGQEPRDGSAVLLSGTYQAPSEVGRRLLAAMPPLLVQPAEAVDATLVTLLATEIERPEPGQEAVLDRLLDLLLVTVVRRWLAAGGPDVPAWHRARTDPAVGPALLLLHEHPARAWTVALLASRVGVSRAGLARRFTALVGQPPMSYLTSWRLTLAADLLREPDATVASVARQVGYSSAFALSTAFKRVHGMSPQEYRAGS